MVSGMYHMVSGMCHMVFRSCQAFLMLSDGGRKFSECVWKVEDVKIGIKF